MAVARPYELQVAITAALKADSALAALVGTRVYDRVPQAVTFPFVEVTQDIGEPFDAIGLDGWEQLIRIDIWSRTGGRSVEATQIAAASYAALHNVSLSLASGDFINGRMIPGGQQMLREDDQETVHVLQRYRYVTQN